MNYILNIKKVHGPYLRPDGRKHVVVMLNDGKRKTVSYPKFLMEQKLGRPLNDDETVDHIDRDFTNDSPSNLQILTRSENSKKSAIRRKPVKGCCAECKKKIELTRAQIRNSKEGKSGPFCSKTCSGKFGKKVQVGLKSTFTYSVNVEHYRNDD